ncbi:PCRF domain-containing protein [Nocardia yamanashiensis]|uniref:PCRF domain-containing protein n=1 Tax=Nocardia yamanashiensis TaxID=209247 RepID=UPI00082DEA7F
MAAEERSFEVEVPALRERVGELAAELGELLRPRDPCARDNTLLDIRAVREDPVSAAFADDLARMYRDYARERGWRVEVVAAAPSEIWSADRPATLLITGRGGTWPAFAVETGLHRVRRFPLDRACGPPVEAVAEVLAYPEPARVNRILLPESEIRVDTWCRRYNCWGGPNNYVYLTHVPTGITAYTETYSSGLSGKALAMRVLAARIKAVADGRATASDFVRWPTISRADVVRTYDLIAGHMVDHRRAITISGPLEPGALAAIVAELARE